MSLAKVKYAWADQHAEAVL